MQDHEQPPRPATVLLHLFADATVEVAEELYDDNDAKIVCACCVERGRRCAASISPVPDVSMVLAKYLPSC